jgi:hypothetical protein
VWAGWFVGGASGQEAAWRPATPRPLAIARTEGVPLGRPAGVSIGRPQPLEAAAVEPGGVIVTSFRAASDSLAPALLPARGLTVSTAGETATYALQAAPAQAPPFPPGLETVFASDIPTPVTAEQVMPADGPVPVETPLPAGPLPSVPLEPGETIVAAEPPVFSWESALSPEGRLYLSGEYLLWWTRGFNTPPLATTSPPNVPQAVLVNGTLVPIQGVLGQPTTTVLFGGSPVTQDPQSGARFYAGYWLDCEHLWAVEVGGFFLGRSNQSFDVNSATTPVITRPFSARTPGGTSESVEFVATPGINAGDLFSSRGSLHIDTPSQLWGTEANVRCNLCCLCDLRVDLLAGFRYLNLEEGLHITENLTIQNAVPAAGLNVGDQVVVTDRFDTRNEFYGGQVGVAAEWKYGRWFVDGTFKLALGDVHQVVDIHGSTTITSAGAAPRVTNAGLLALASNSGTFSRDQFAVAPELTLKVGYQVTERLRAYLGYNFLYLSSVVRPGDQIDRTLDVNQIPGNPSTPVPPPARPLVPFKTSDFWAQGLVFGLEWRY